MNEKGITLEPHAQKVRRIAAADRKREQAVQDLIKKLTYEADAT